MASLLTRLLSTQLQLITTAHLVTAPLAHSAQLMFAGILNLFLLRPTLFTQTPPLGRPGPIKSPPMSKIVMIEWQLVLQSVLPPLIPGQQLQ